MSLFEKGVSGNPAGRPKGLLTGRAKALYALDQVTRLQPVDDKAQSVRIDY